MVKKSASICCAIFFLCHFYIYISPTTIFAGEISSTQNTDKEKTVNMPLPNAEQATDIEEEIHALAQKGSAALHGLDPQRVIDSQKSISPEVQKEAEEALKHSQKESPAAVRAYQQYVHDAKRKKELEQYQRSVVAGTITDVKGNVVNKNTVEEYVRRNSERSEYNEKYLVVFISSSMPISTIRTFMEVYGDNPYTVFVLRGVIDNNISKIKPTLRWIRQFACGNDSDPETCHQAPIDINPDLFKRFNINQVPAVLYTPLPASLVSACEGPISVEDNDFLVVYGDAEPLVSLNAFLRARPDDLQLQTVIQSIRKSSKIDAPNS